MTRELDIEIARLDGCEPSKTPEPYLEDTCTCADFRHGEVGRNGNYHYVYLWPYSSDLNALMELIRRRWPDHLVCLSPSQTWISTVPQLGDGERMFRAPEDGDYAERLAHAVRDALRAEQP